MTNEHQKWYVGHDQLRERLIEAYKNKPMSLAKLSKAIGINSLTLTRFLNDNARMQSKVYMSIEKYLNDNSN
jgi:lambda repressor-like predicted transcriptional regulator